MLSIAVTSRVAQLHAALTWPHWVTQAFIHVIHSKHSFHFRVNFEGPHRYLCAARPDGVPALGLPHV